MVTIDHPRTKLASSLDIVDDVHAVVAAQLGRRLAIELGFSLVEQTALSTAILEITRNIVKYAGKGKISISEMYHAGKNGILIVASDQGPGIPDIGLALKDGFSTGRSLGLGLPGARRLMDTFDIVSQVGQGTTVTMGKWKS
ncbi:MAG: anti-sigma regulatory factor [Anaerolineae bacterium]